MISDDHRVGTFFLHASISSSDESNDGKFASASGGDGSGGNTAMVADAADKTKTRRPPSSLISPRSRTTNDAAD
jgi:hypothetical protein